MKQSNIDKMFEAWAGMLISNAVAIFAYDYPFFILGAFTAFVGFFVWWIKIVLTK